MYLIKLSPTSPLLLCFTVRVLTWYPLPRLEVVHQIQIHVAGKRITYQDHMAIVQRPPTLPKIVQVVQGTRREMQLENWGLYCVVYIS